MKIKILTICDFAADYNGRLSITGTTDRFLFPAFPSMPVSFCLACQFELEGSKLGEHPVMLSFVKKSSGKHYLPIQELKLKVTGTEVEKDRRLLTNLVMKIDNVSFDGPGTYIINVRTEDCEESIELYVDKIESAN